MASARLGQLLGAGLLGLAATSCPAAQNQASLTGYRNERHGFLLSYPADRFIAQRASPHGEGCAFLSRDGRARFTCAGRLIKSWAMLYPAAERRVYDPILEEMARSYRPGQSSCEGG